MSHSLERNKASALDCDDMMFNPCRPVEAIERIVEHRAGLQVVPNTAAHGNGMF